jgi:hypothetical protein
MRSLSSRVVVFSLQRPSARVLFRDASKGIIGKVKSASDSQLLARLKLDVPEDAGALGGSGFNKARAAANKRWRGA